MGRKGKFLIVLVCVFGHACFGLEFVAREQAQDLARRFTAARQLTKAEVSNFSNKDWRCDMYGMRTRLQVERDVKLYRFSPSGRNFINLGAQMIQAYGIEGQGFIGRRGKLTDLVKAGPEDTLIAQLSMGSAVLAYSVCKATPIL